MDVSLLILKIISINSFISNAAFIQLPYNLEPECSLQVCSVGPIVFLVIF